MGLGYLDYTTYEALGELQIEAGWQGSQHINVSLRATGVDELEGYTCSMWLVDRSDQDRGVVVVPPEPAECEYIPLEDMYPGDVPDDVDVDTVFMPWHQLIIEEPSDIIDRTLELRVSVRAEEGRTGRAWFNGPVTWMPEADDGTR